MNQAEANLALTETARQIADQKGLPFARRVRYVDHEVDNADLVVRRNSRCIYLNSNLPVNSAIAALEDSILQAARVDFGIWTKEDIDRQTQRLEEVVSNLAWKATKAARSRDWDRARSAVGALDRAIDRLQKFVQDKN